MVHWLFQQSETEADPVADSPGKFPFQVEELGMCLFLVKVDGGGGGVTIFKSTGVYAALRHKAEPLLLPALAPNQTHFTVQQSASDTQKHTAQGLSSGQR